MNSSDARLDATADVYFDLLSQLALGVLIPERGLVLPNLLSIESQDDIHALCKCQMHPHGQVSFLGRLSHRVEFHGNVSLCCGLIVSTLSQHITVVPLSMNDFSWTFFVDELPVKGVVHVGPTNIYIRVTQTSGFDCLEITNCMTANIALIVMDAMPGLVARRKLVCSSCVSKEMDEPHDWSLGKKYERWLSCPVCGDKVDVAKLELDLIVERGVLLLFCVCIFYSSQHGVWQARFRFRLANTTQPKR